MDKYYINILLCDKVINPYPISNDALTNPMLDLGHEWLITF